MTQITAFRGRYSFLSNFHPSPVRIGAFTAPTVEHAYQALKTLSEEEVKWVLEAETPAGAKRRGRRVTLRPDWQAVQLAGMEQALRLKFAPGSELAGMLLATGDAELIEGNYWNDRFWGVCRGEGLNHLGRLLMKIRRELRELGQVLPGLEDPARLSPVHHPAVPTGAPIPPRMVRKPARPAEPDPSWSRGTRTCRRPSRRDVLKVAVDPGTLPAAGHGAAGVDRAEGMVLGLAIGDALGNTSERLTVPGRRKAHGEIRDYLPNPGAEDRRVGLPSDDTQLATRILEHVLESGTVNPPRLADVLASRPITGMGRTMRAFLKARVDGGHWLDHAQDMASNGALMRIATVLLPHVASPGPALWRDALLASAVTHNSYASNASCVAFVAVLLDALSATPPVPRGFWLDRFVEVARQLEGDERRYTPRVKKLANRQVSIWEFTDDVVRKALAGNAPTLKACNSWHSGAYLLETVPSALFILERNGNNPEEAIVRAVNDTKDNDTIGAIVGSAVGALHGAARLPERWRSGLLGRTDSEDDGRVQESLGQAKAKWWDGTTPVEARGA